MKIFPSKPPELLAPAGNLETALAAFDAGADAVYAGLGRFNARERAENFTPETMAKLTDFAREQGKKVYLTLNTLVFESELPAAAEALAAAVRLRPDAVIVQDPGVIALIRRYFPELRIHASTQMGIHNAAGVAVAAKLGAERVILERQLTLAELRRIALGSSVELEVFIHGSLCCSLSGRCLLSSRLFHCSGNRGQCKQPCRRRYDGKFLLSPADLSGVEILDELRKLNIASLKIEGRLRPPEYVWKTARAYRMLLDHPDDPAVCAEAVTLLKSAAGRPAARGFFFASDYPRLIAADRSGMFGIPAARIEQCARRGLTVTTLTRLHLGDRLRPASPEGGDQDSFSLTALTTATHRDAVRVPPGTSCFIPGDFRAAPGWMLYKVGENGFDFSRRAAALPPPGAAVTPQITATPTQWTVAVREFPGWCWEKRVAFAPATRHALDRAALQAEFASGAPAPWRPLTPETTVDGAFFVPASVLKTLRREFWTAFAAAHSPTALPDAGGRGLYEFQRDYTAAAADATPTTPTGQFLENTVVFPAFVAETDWDAAVAKLRRSYRDGVRRIRSGGLHALQLPELFPGLEILAEFPLMVANSPGAALLQRHGVIAAEAEPELPETEFALLQAHTPLPLYRTRRAVPLLATRLPLPPGRWRDDSGRQFQVRFDAAEKLSLLYADDAELP